MESFQVLKRIAEIIMSFCVIWLNRCSPTKTRNSFFKTAAFLEGKTEIAMRLSEVYFDADRQVKRDKGFADVIQALEELISVIECRDVGSVIMGDEEDIFGN